MATDAMTEPGSSAQSLLLRGGLVWTETDYSIGARPVPGYRTAGQFSVQDVLIRDDRIAAIRPDVAVTPETEVLDCSNLLVLPGLCNAHTHAHNVFAKGVLDRGCLESLINVQAPVTRGRTPEETYAAALLNACEMIRLGCTSCCEQCMIPASSEHVDAVAQAYVDAGLRACISVLISDESFYDKMPGLLESLPEPLRKEAVNRRPGPIGLGFLEGAVSRWHKSNGGRITVAVAPSIPLVCTDELLVLAAGLAREHDLRVFTHLAESRLQVALGLRQYGRSVTAHLADIGFLSDRTVLAHAVWVTDEDMDFLADSGCVVVHVPGSNLRLGSGVAPVRDMMKRRIPIALGTDGSAGSGSQNMFETMRLAAFVSRIRSSNQDDWLSAGDVLSMATAMAPLALGTQAQLGVLKEGYKADLTLLRMDSYFFHPLNDPLTQMVVGETGANVDTVIVDGRRICARGEITTVDEEKVFAGADEAAKNLRERNAREWQASAQLRPFFEDACVQASEGLPLEFDASHKLGRSFAKRRRPEQRGGA